MGPDGQLHEHGQHGQEDGRRVCPSKDILSYQAQHHLQGLAYGRALLVQDQESKCFDEPFLQMRPEPGMSRISRGHGMTCHWCCLITQMPFKLWN